MDPFVGQVSIFGFIFPPRGWAFCQGQLLPLSQNVALFQVLGASYGGNGISTFALPNLQGKAAVGAGQGPSLSAYPLGATGGQAAVTLQSPQMPNHRHAFTVSTSAATAASPQGNLLARATRPVVRGAEAEAEVAAPAPGPTQIEANFYSANPANARTPLHGLAVGFSGSNQPHNNMQPYLALNFCIALQGMMPQRG
jgi:microcystin-dependent protein